MLLVAGLLVLFAVGTTVFVLVLREALLSEISSAILIVILLYWLLSFLVSFVRAGAASRPALAVLSFIGIILLMILSLFADIYFWAGINLSGSSDQIKDFSTCLYFSVITWTTVGYGDIVPTPGIARLAASLEALSGIAVMGAYVSALVNILNPTRAPMRTAPMKEEAQNDPSRAGKR
jgi:hypothetical protein